MLAGLTAVLGIAQAAVQPRLQRVIAYSSVENSGLILAGFGVALVGAALGDRRLLAVGLLAATLQVVAHTLAKSLLFTASAPIEAADGRDNLDDLRGVGRRRPWSGTGLAVGGADPGRPAADGRVRVGVVPAGIAHAAVPGPRPGLPRWCWRSPARRSRLPPVSPG